MQCPKADSPEATPHEGDSAAVSVVIATCNRAAWLRNALESVRRQTARQAIAQVIVSENSTDDRSSDVCRQFSDLPIVYVQQRPPVPVNEHLRSIWGLVENPVVAWLHDDDWWASSHLRDALNVLRSDQGCVAVFSHYFETYGPRYPTRAARTAWLVWICSGFDFGHPVLQIDQVGAMLGGLLDTAFHYSTLVGRKEAIWDAYLAVAGCPYPDNDRMFSVILGSRGRIGYLTAPGVFVRQHMRQATWSDGGIPEVVRKKVLMLRWMVQAEPTLAALAAKRFNETAGRLGAKELALLSAVIDTHIYEPRRTALIEQCGLNLPPRHHMPSGAPLGYVAPWYAKCFFGVCPPALAPLAVRMKRGAGTLWRTARKTVRT